MVPGARPFGRKTTTNIQSYYRQIAENFINYKQHMQVVTYKILFIYIILIQSELFNCEIVNILQTKPTDRLINLEIWGVEY